jgi:hypothetical protein
MKYSICIPLLILLGCRYPSQLPVIVESGTVKGIICTEAKSWNYVLQGREIWMPTVEQVLEAEAIIETFLHDNYPALGKVVRERQYFRQYVGWIGDGHKGIYCNFFCDPLDPKDFEETDDVEARDRSSKLNCNPVQVEDGGDCFFQIYYDADERKVINLMVNDSG